jgi:hypothetical protein
MGTLSNPAASTEAPTPLRASRPLALSLHLFLLASALVFFALHFVHLSADFPNFSRWMDWSKYTDEGWYGDAAIRHVQLGHWYLPGDFNPAVALPVWPILESLLFRFTGVSLIAVRALTVAVFGGILLAAWFLIARSSPLRPRTSLAGSVAVLLLAANPFCFVFTRIAILEPLLILLLLFALLAAQQARLPLTSPAASSWRDRPLSALSVNAIPVLALGLLLPLIVLTKTTGLFLIPAVAWTLFAALDYRPRLFFQVGIPAAALAAGLWLAYFLLLVRPHYLLDYRYLFSANAYTGISRSNYRTVIVKTIEGGFWFGGFLYVSALAAIAVALFNLRQLRRYPLIPTLLLWAGGYAAFLAYHNNLQPRYYLVVAVPLTLLVPVVFRDLVMPRFRYPFTAAMGRLVAGIVFAFLIILPDAIQTIAIVRRPQYTFLTAARQIQSFIATDHRNHPAHSALVLSISGSDLSLMTGLHSICDDFGTAELVDRVNQYNPGWYAAWNLIEDDKMDALTPGFHVERVATFPALDDPDRNLLILYRLEPADAVPEAPHHPRRELRHFRNKLGQQPSPEQLQH